MPAAFLLSRQNDSTLIEHLVVIAILPAHAIARLSKATIIKSLSNQKQRSWGVDHVHQRSRRHDAT
ncbi:MAG: hypothetical protein M2R45_03134 [Verrucomicrobia subdivision 3 bacterium]|nr:hypothetical protein [Limisphaerales bacterium]MCS1413202.1 hypothetical protein [Limisphaerales bacterium]